MDRVIALIEQNMTPDPNSGCWLWTGRVDRQGYGLLWLPGEKRQARAHRLSFEAFVCAANDLAICHHCDNPSCVNPRHLFAGTIADNNRDRMMKGRSGFGPRSRPVSGQLLTRNRATIKLLSEQPRAASSGRFGAVAPLRYRATVGAPVRVGRPSAITPELAVEAERLLRMGVTIAELLKRLGVDRRSWYRYVHRSTGVRSTSKTRRRRSNAISREVEQTIMRLDAEGLTRVTIAERVGLHINTVVKYLLRAGRRKS